MALSLRVAIVRARRARVDPACHSNPPEPVGDGVSSVMPREAGPANRRPFSDWPAFSISSASQTCAWRRD